MSNLSLRGTWKAGKRKKMNEKIELEEEKWFVRKCFVSFDTLKLQISLAFFLILRLRFSYSPPPTTLRIIDFHNHQYFIEQVLNVSPSHNRYAYKSTFFSSPTPLSHFVHLKSASHPQFSSRFFMFFFFLSLRVFTAVIWQKKIITEKWVKIMKQWWQFLYVLLFFITFASWSGAVDHLVSGEICIAIRLSLFFLSIEMNSRDEILKYFSFCRMIKVNIYEEIVLGGGRFFRIFIY